jgi:hypothetical protein
MNRSRIASLLCVAMAGCSGSSTSPAPVFAPPATIGFANAAIESPFVIHRESGYVIQPYAGSWSVLNNYGDPAPYIGFTRPASQDTTSGEIRITADGALFRFASVELYSSITTIPYSLTGFLGSSTVFAVSGTVPNTLGRFAVTVNPRAADVIDGLAIRISNPQCAAFMCSNPVGLDNIRVGY